MPQSMLITGGAGFIGFNAANYFLSRGWTVTVLDNFSRRGTRLNAEALRARWGKSVKILTGDVRSRKSTESIVEDYDVVLHLAAQVAVTTSVVEPWGDFKSNTLGTLRVLDAVRNSKRRPIFIFSSTNKVYGSLEDLLLHEDATRYSFSDGRHGISEHQQLDFHSPYGCSKGAADQYVHDYARLYDMKTVVFRQSCIYGPQQFGVEDQGWVAWFLAAAMMKKHIQVYGDGKQVRDLLHVADLVHAYELAIEKIDIASGKVYNIGGGETNTLSLLELLSFMKNEVSLSPSFTHAAVRPGDQKIFVSDNSLVQKDLGWTPTVSVQQGVKELAHWLSDNEEAIKAVYNSPVPVQHKSLLQRFRQLVASGI